MDSEADDSDATMAADDIDTAGEKSPSFLGTQ